MIMRANVMYRLLTGMMPFNNTRFFGTPTIDVDKSLHLYDNIIRRTVQHHGCSSGY